MKKHHKLILQAIESFFKTQSWNLNSNLIKSPEEDENFIYVTLLSKDKDLLISKTQRVLLFEKYLRVDKSKVKLKKAYSLGLLKYFYNLIPESFIRIIKREARFLFQNTLLLDLLKEVLNSEHEYLLSSFHFFVKQRTFVRQEERELTKELSPYPIDELIFLLSTWFDKQYVDGVKKDVAYNIINPLFEEAFSYILNLKRRSGQALTIDKCTLDLPLWKEDLFLTLVPSEFKYFDKATSLALHLKKKFYSKLKTLANSPDTFSSFNKIMQKALSIVSWKIMEDDFCLRDGQLLEQKEKDHFLFLPNNPEEEKKWHKIGSLEPILFNYYAELGKANSSYNNPLLYNQTDQAVAVRWQLNGFPKSIPLPECTFKPYELLIFLNGIRLFHKTRYYECLNDTIKANPNKESLGILLEAEQQKNLWIKPIMGGLNCTSIPYLVERVKGYVTFDASLEDADLIQMLNFISYDIESSSNALNLLETPFIKIGEVLVYNTLSVYLNNPSIIIENFFFRKEKLMQQKLHAEKSTQLKDVVSLALEEKIEDLFQKSGFNTLHGVQLEKGNEGEIDVLVWKGSELLIIEAKKTYTRRNIKSIELYTKTLEKAGKQTSKCIDYVNKNKHAFLKEHNIKIAPKNLKIYGLIISSTQEGNFSVYGEGAYSKISLIELSILLHDTKSALVDSYEKAFEFHFKDREKGRKYLKQIQSKIIQNPLSLDARNELKGIVIAQSDRLEEHYRSCYLWIEDEPSISKLVKAVEEDWLWFDLDYEIEKDVKEPPVNTSPEIREAYLLYLQAKKYYDANDLSKTISIIRKAVQIYPNDLDSLALLADALADSGEKEEALVFYTEVISQDSSYEMAYLNRALTYYELGLKEKALMDYEKFLSIKPFHDMALYNSFVVKHELGLLKNKKTKDLLDFVNTIEDKEYNQRATYLVIQNMLESFKEDDNGCLLELANNLYQQGGNEEAIRSQVLGLLDKCLENDQYYIKAYQSKGVILLNHQEYKAAINIFDKLLSLTISNEERAITLTQKGIALLHDSSSVGTVKDLYFKALTIDKNCYLAHYNLAVIYQMYDKTFSLAINHYNEAIKGDEEIKKRTLGNLAYIHKESGQYDLALAYLKELVILGDYSVVPEYIKIEHKIKQEL